MPTKEWATRNKQARRAAEINDWIKVRLVDRAAGKTAVGVGPSLPAICRQAGFNRLRTTVFFIGYVHHFGRDESEVNVW